MTAWKGADGGRATTTAASFAEELTLPNLPSAGGKAGEREGGERGRYHH